ncbi:MAG: TonB-dependent receptor, partial [Pseudomonadota bacterium]
TISVPYLHSFLIGPGFVPPGFFSGPIDFQDSNWSPEATIKYEVNPDFNVFASFKTGFKSGGIDNSALPSASLGAAAQSGDFSALIYDSETAIGGEVGIKSQWADRSFTLNATAYYYVFDDLQVQNFDGATIQFLTLNAGEVTTQGVDIGWNWSTPVEGLNLSGNIAYLDAAFSDTFITEDPDGVANSGDETDINGRDTARSPTWSGNLAVDWFIPLGDTLELGFGGNAIYTDSYFTDEVTNNDFRQDSYVAFDATVSIGDQDGKWKLALVGTNLTDEIWVNTSGERPFRPATGDDLVLTQNRGRQVYVEATVNF